MSKRYHRPTRLTEREEQVVLLRADGMAGKEIAELLGISAKTVFEYQRRAIYKLGVRSMRGAARRVKVERFRIAHNV
jgi:DNA-binding CsgD family transcriptional regulator